MKIKTSELKDILLDWAVAKCEKVSVMKYPESPNLFYSVGFDKYRPSTDWAQGGPIIERAQISLRTNALIDGHWVAFIDFGASITNIKARQSGPTPLIAAMQCYVASKLGDMVDIPDNLV